MQLLISGVVVSGFMMPEIHGTVNSSRQQFGVCLSRNEAFKPVTAPDSPLSDEVNKLLTELAHRENRGIL